MNFKQRIWLLPIMVALIGAIGIGVNTKITTSAASSLKKVEDIQYPLVEALRALRADHEAIQELLQQAVAEGDKAALNKVDERVSSAHNTLSRMKNLGDSASALSSSLSAKFDTYVGSATRASRLMLGEEKGDTSSIIRSMQSDNEALKSQLDTSSTQAIQYFKDLLSDSKDSLHNLLQVTIISALITMVILGMGSYFLIGNVFRILGGEPEHAVAVVRRIATGDFTQRIDTHGSDRDSLLYSIASLQEKLGMLIQNIHQSSGAVDNAANEMNSAVGQLSERTSNQAGSLEETAASMEEMTTTVKQNADNARQANQLAAEARSQAESGGAIVNKAIAAMSQINESSRRIADIITVIDEIAFQTNLLALNAAVEAARAGEQGRGFAVVASEVRNLAQRSATAAREIKSLIQDSVIKVQDGSQLVDDSGQRLHDIVTSVKKVADIIADISAASQEQARGLDQVNNTVAELDHVTQQNSAMVNQASTVADRVALQAKRLLEIVSVFRVHRQHAAGTSVATPTQAPAGDHTDQWARVA